MGKGAARTQGSRGENISHINAIRMRVVGEGELQLTLFSLDEIESQTLASIAMTGATNRQPTRLANFIQQRALLKLETNDINDYFRINRIIIFTKELWSSYPG